MSSYHGRAVLVWDADGFVEADVELVTDDRLGKPLSWSGTAVGVEFDAAWSMLRAPKLHLILPGSRIGDALCTRLHESDAEPLTLTLLGVGMPPYA